MPKVKKFGRFENAHALKALEQGINHPQNLSRRTILSSNVLRVISILL